MTRRERGPGPGRALGPRPLAPESSGPPAKAGAHGPPATAGGPGPGRRAGGRSGADASRRVAAGLTAPQEHAEGVRTPPQERAEEARILPECAAAEGARTPPRSKRASSTVTAEAGQAAAGSRSSSAGPAPGRFPASRCPSTSGSRVGCDPGPPLHRELARRNFDAVDLDDICGRDTGLWPVG